MKVSGKRAVELETPDFTDAPPTFRAIWPSAFDEQPKPRPMLTIRFSGLGTLASDQAAAGNCQIVPIVHASANELPIGGAAVAIRTGVTMLAVRSAGWAMAFLAVPGVKAIRTAPETKSGVT